MKKFPIDSMADYELLRENGFDMSLEENITPRFVRICSFYDEQHWKDLANRINLNSIGTYKLSILHVTP